MSERVKIESTANPTWPEWFVVEAAAAAGNKLCEITENSPEDGVFEISLKVNGIEVPFLAAIKSFEDQIERMIRHAAQEQVGKHIGDVLNKLTAMGEEVDVLTKQIKVEMAPSPLIKLTGDRPAR